ncbi:GntR family transcriptional regulator [uncultured Salinisphaera sp.]|uniref:GntR family transcriptional regulator n=1 Tax=Salinisphaera sp. C84B14 TaxID=1304155 RepID=UPI0032B29897
MPEVSDSQNPLLDAQEIASPSGRRTDQDIYRAIANAIFEQRLPSATKLPEDSLGDIFSVSRTVVRKALFRLASEKLVDIRPNRGAMVASPTVEEARDVFESRRIVEAASVEAAMQRMTDDGRARLERLVFKDHAAHQERSRRHWIRYSGAFHLEIAEIAGNQVLKAFLKELIGRTSLIIGLYEPMQRTVCTYDEHQTLLDAMIGGDIAHGVRTMVDHLVDCEQRLGLERRDRDIDLRAIFADGGD